MVVRLKRQWDRLDGRLVHSARTCIRQWTCPSRATTITITNIAPPPPDPHYPAYSAPVGYTGTIPDTSGNGNDCCLYGNAAVEEDGSLYFDGSDGTWASGDSAALPMGAADRTIALDLKLSALGVNQFSYCWHWYALCRTVRLWAC